MKLPQIPECSREEWLRNTLLTDEQSARVLLPLCWHEEYPFPIGHPLHGVKMYAKGGLRVLFSADASSFDKPWLHVSMSRKSRLPSYEDLTEVKKIFIGDDRQAIQVFPVRQKHINIHPYCLHLWCCLAPEGDGLPDFGKFGTI